MRLEQGQMLPPRAALMLRLHYALVLLIVLLGICAWLPEAQGRLLLARGVNLLTALYLWQLAGLYMAPVFTPASGPDAAEDGGAAPGLGLALSIPLLAAAAAVFMPLAAGAVVLLLASVLLAGIEHLPSQRRLWPVPWLAARRQQTQLLVVALASAAVAVWSVGQVY
ncbi:hypothetical protein K8B33_04255 [Alcanivorax sp. JB21]|uniref:hypothetical protein n=1 Tax=Alcanivorax limicola TaxID=2874102 RepID=UPI001CBB2487|nr:hypothetical protein [Alcanivorax limicola]MBZ2188293.1 hypothetical protein [Alcanivorax limicola]